jgi:hypothetical protein
MSEEEFRVDAKGYILNVSDTQSTAGRAEASTMKELVSDSGARH